MMFLAFVNLAPCLMAIILAWIIKTGEVPFGIALMRIFRSKAPVQYAVFVSGYAFIIIILMLFAIYLDYSAFISH